MPSTMDSRPSASLIFSQFVFTCSAPVTFVSPKTCGCRLISFAVMLSITSTMVKCLLSSANDAWKTMCSSKSPSSFLSSSWSFSSIASTTSYAYSKVFALIESWVCSLSQGHSRRRRRTISTNSSNEVDGKLHLPFYETDSVWSWSIRHQTTIVQHQC